MKSQNTLIGERIMKSDGSASKIFYRKIRLLGKGKCSQCYLVQRIDDKVQFAIKIIAKHFIQKYSLKQKMMTEINLHRIVKHKRIVKLQKIFEDQINIYILLEPCVNGDMSQLLQKRITLTIIQAQYYIYQLISAVCYLHTLNIIHRDIKLANLMIDSSMNIKLGDFGIATKLIFHGDKKHSLCGTPNFTAPEIINSVVNKNYDSFGHSLEVDIWAIGIVLYIFLIGCAPFAGINKTTTFANIISLNYSFPSSFNNNQAKDLIKNILVIDPSKRYTLQQILKHPFMNPKKGIPMSLSSKTLTRAPKLNENYQKYQDEEVQNQRQIARSTSRSRISIKFSQSVTNEQNSKKNSKEKEKLLKMGSTSLQKMINKLQKQTLIMSSKKLLAPKQE